MIDPNKMSDEDRAVLQGIADSKKITLEEALVELGHELPKSGDEPDDVVELTGNAEVQETTPEVPEVRTISFGGNAGLDQEPAAEVEVPEVSSAVELPPTVEEEPEPEPEPEVAGSDSTINTVCCHCGWDNKKPVIAEPDAKEKLSFLQCVLGAVPFQKKFSLFGGNLKVTFRTLTIKEIDRLYADTFEAHKAGNINTASDYYEYLNRLRMHVQLVSIKGTTVPLHWNLPDGIDKSTNKAATVYWEDYLKEKKIYKEGQSLPLQIQDFVLENVLITEQLLRVISFECNKFNRLAAKLEARVDDSDFWKETEQLS